MTDTVSLNVNDRHKEPNEMSEPQTCQTKDIFSDIEALRLPQNFTALVGVKRKLVTVPVKKPEKTWFVRVHPDPAYSTQAAVLELKDDRETYLVTPDVYRDLAGGESAVTPRLIHTAINRQGVVFLWPARLPGPDGKFD